MKMLVNRRGKLSSDVSSSADEPRQLVSHANNAAQNFLLVQLSQARMQRGLSIPDVAEKLKADPSLIEDMETGHYEPNLSELRAYAWAIEAVLEYRVHACMSGPLAAYEARIRWSSQGEDIWDATVDISWTETADNPLTTGYSRDFLEGKHK